MKSITLVFEPTDEIPLMRLLTEALALDSVYIKSDKIQVLEKELPFGSVNDREYFRNGEKEKKCI